MEIECVVENIIFFFFYFKWLEQLFNNSYLIILHIDWKVWGEVVETSPLRVIPCWSEVTLKPDKSGLWVNGSIGQTWGATRATGHFDSRVSLDWSTMEMSLWSHYSFCGVTNAASPVAPPLPSHAAECLSWSNQMFVITFTAPCSLSLPGNSWMTNLPQISWQHSLTGFA